MQTGQRVARILPAESTVETTDGSRERYDQLLLATGSEPRKLQVPGGQLGGVLQLRTLDDADRIREAVLRGTLVAVIGGGWIGAEVAACCRQLGADVTLFTGSKGLLERQLGGEISAIYTELHSGRGVNVRPGAEVVALEGTNGQVRGVVLRDGSVVAAETVVVGIGASPRLALAVEAGLNVDRGVLVGPLFQTSAAGIWAVGDIAEAWHPLLARRVLLDHWAAAWFGGTAAAKSMLGLGTPYERIPYLYSDQYDLSMEAWGVPPTWDEVVVRRGSEPGSFLSFWLEEGTIVGAMLGNLPGARPALEALVRTRARIAPARLADGSIPVEELASVGGRPD